MFRRITQRDDFGMRRRVTATDRTIRSTTNHTLALHDDRTDRHLASERCRSRQLQRFAHEFAIANQRTTCQLV